MRSTLLILSLVFATFPLAQANNTKPAVYSWKDDKGVTHFGQRPPESVKATIVTKRRFLDDNEKAAQEAISAEWKDGDAKQEPDSRKAKIEAYEVTRIDPDRCAAAKKNLSMLSANGHIRVTETDGSKRNLDLDEKDAKIAEMHQAIAESCEE